jgi:hypothetical protein
MHFLTPTFQPAGGVVKLFDYLVHALDLGYVTQVHCPHRPKDNEPLFTIPRFRTLPEDSRVRFHDSLSVGVAAHSWVVFSWPPHYETIARGMSSDTAHERVIHLVQNTRHANPAFTDGYALRLLSRPMARIMVAEEVMEACAPLLNPHSLSTTIVEGHDWSFFHRTRRPEPHQPIRVAYTTWKSDLGVYVQRSAPDGFAFRSIRRSASWPELRELFHWCDVFLCCPGPEEGFYLPGLEAMAAGAIVITPDVGGNRAYCRFGDNCVLVGLEDVGAYVSALETIATWSYEQVEEIRKHGYETLQNHTLARERSEFGRFLLELAPRCTRPQSEG